VLSRYADVSPGGWRFVRSALGKPEVRLPPLTLPSPPRGGEGKGGWGSRSLCFNLTHTRGLAACAVTWDREVGVDAEDWQRQGRELSEGLIRYCLSPEERACLKGLPPAERKRGFFDYWTLKEAYIKARGLGLSLP